MQCPLCGGYNVSTYRYDVLSDLAHDKYWCHNCSVYFDSPLSMKNKAAIPEPPPDKGQEIVLYHIIDDLHARAEMGEGKYGTVLKTHNGRNALMDAYQEALDLCMYLKQVLLEQEK